SYLSDLLPGLLVISIGFGPVFVGVTTAANAGVPPETAGLAASLLNASQQLGAALGLAIFSAVATRRANALLPHPTSRPSPRPPRPPRRFCRPSVAGDPFHPGRRGARFQGAHPRRRDGPIRPRHRLGDARRRRGLTPRPRDPAAARDRAAAAVLGTTRKG